MIDLLISVCHAHPGHGPESAILHTLTPEHAIPVLVIGALALAVRYARRRIGGARW